MKKTEAIRLAEIQERKEIIRAFIGNPMVSLVAGVIILELAERAKITGSVITTTTETGLIAVTTAQALAPVLPQLTEGASNIVKAVSPL